MPAELTPMKKQYNEMKAKYTDCLLFFRLGDFYEMFDDDAVLASKELDLALTTRDRGKAEEDRTPMCGVPYHSAEAYIARLIAKGYKVAICEQLEDPALAKGLVTRDVIRIITPGTVTESSMLEESLSNYIASVYLEGGTGGISFCDVSTGEFCAGSFPENALTHILNELGRFTPREVLLSPEAEKCEEITFFLRERLGAMMETGVGGFEKATAAGEVSERFGPEADLAGAGEEGVRAAGALLAYLVLTQKFDLSHINHLDVIGGRQLMELDYTTLRSLELTESLKGDRKRTLLSVLDRTRTPMGGRLLRSWVERPLLSPQEIGLRLNAVRELVDDSVLRGELMHRLKDIGDLRRTASKAVYGTAGGKDLRSLCNYCLALPEVKRLVSGCTSRALAAIAGMDVLEDLAAAIDQAIAEDPPFSVREGGILRPGYNEEVDRLRDVRANGADMMRRLEENERVRTGIKKLKIGYNRVFGYYIEISNAARGDAEIPAEYIRKQTLSTGERYFTPELKELENTLLTAGDRLADLEYNLFCEVRDRVAAEIVRIQAAADGIAALDCYCSLAEAAARNGYTMPEIDLGRSLIIENGRHPVVEQTVDAEFVPNDTILDEQNPAAIITGPNMAGKSTYMRQTALIVLMAQMGSFVPATRAKIGIVDRVFTRIGASDDLSAGQSTFMVEMTETAAILRNATSRSLIILDEIGRGTSTYDGMAIARAVLEYCADRKKLGAKTMFATHYRELSVLEDLLPGVRNYSITARKQSGRLIFLRKIIPGAADASYGIEVAQLAGVPDSVLRKARAYLKQLEDSAVSPEIGEVAEEPDQVSFGALGEDQVRRTLMSTDLNSLTPLAALNLIAEMKKMIE